MKILKRAQIIKNLILFVFLSIYYLYIVSTIISGKGAVDLDNFLVFSKSHTILISFSLITIWSIYELKLWSKNTYLLFTTIIFSNSFMIFLNTENKLVLLGTFFYLFISFFLYLLWKEELSNCVYNPGFFDNQLDTKNKYGFKVILKNLSGKEFEGFLTNWDNYSCFVCLDEKVAYSKLKGELELQVKYLDKPFFVSGNAVTNFSNGYGISFKKDDKINEFLNWKDFYAIITDRGVRPGLNRMKMI